jgi:biotin transporter BioY
MMNITYYMFVLAGLYGRMTYDVTKGYFVYYAFIAIVTSWFHNYIIGCLAYCFRRHKESPPRVRKCWWFFYFFWWFGYAVDISYFMAFVNPDDGNYWLVSLAICIVIDMLLFDLIIVVIAKELSSRIKKLHRMTRFFKFRGYYE